MNFSGSQPLARAPRLFVFSGAGLSAESGVPTFRSTDGIWSKFDLDEVCNFNLWRKHRSAVFRFYEDRRKEIEAAQPNGAHRLLALWQHTWGADRVRLITQNVDNLLERAAARDVVHLQINPCAAASNGGYGGIAVTRLRLIDVVAPKAAMTLPSTFDWRCRDQICPE
jgi:NAD-dependent SIR2 family protein deacetylase